MPDMTGSYGTPSDFIAILREFPHKNDISEVLYHHQTFTNCSFN